MPIQSKILLPNLPTSWSLGPKPRLHEPQVGNTALNLIEHQKEPTHCMVDKVGNVYHMLQKWQRINLLYPLKS